MFKHEPLLTETDWEKFDGYTPTFRHPNLTDRDSVPARRGLHAVLHASVVPRELPENPELGGARLGQPDGSNDVNDRHTREEIADISGPVACGRWR